MVIKREIYNKIENIKNTKKITKAMEMISITKMHKVYKRMFLIKFYCEKLKRIISNILSVNINYNHSFIFNKCNTKNIGFIFITTDKGLCGSMNSNLFKLFLNRLKFLNISENNVNIFSIGEKGLNFFNRFKYKILFHVKDIGEFPKLKKIIKLINFFLDLYLNNKLNSIYIVYTKFVNTLKQQSFIKQLLPFKNIFNTSGNKYYNNYIYEPNIKVLMYKLMVRYVEIVTLKAIIENKTSEHSARMFAMYSANNSANNIINDLKLKYNKIRQSLITNELSEIISGSINI